MSLLNLYGPLAVVWVAGWWFAVTSVTLTPATLDLEPTDTARVVCVPKNGMGTALTSRCTFLLTDTSVARISARADQSIRVTGRKAGTTKIIGYVKRFNKVRDTVAITVAAAPVPPDTTTPVPPDTTTPPEPPDTTTPPPVSGITYFLADAESGILTPPFPSWAIYPPADNETGKKAVASTTRPKNGARSYQFEVVNPPHGPYNGSAVALGSPNVQSMGCSKGHFCTGWYAGYFYVAEGFTAPTWNAAINFQASDATHGSDPIGHVGLSIRSGVLRLYWYQKNCEPGTYSQLHGAVCPPIPGYGQAGAEYYTTSASPAGIVAYPKNQWVHIAVYYKMAKTNGEVQVWQDGKKILHLTHANLNTMDGNQYYNNAGGDLVAIGWGLYHGSVQEARRLMFIDDIRVSNYRPVP